MNVPARAAALAVAIGLLGACRPSARPVVVPAGLPDEEPAVRVGVVVDADEVRVGAPGGFSIARGPGGAVESGAPGETWVFTADARGGIIARGPTGRRVGPITGPLTIRPRDEDAPLEVDGRRYRGAVLVHSPGPGRVTAVNVLALEDYLLGVVPHEIGPRPEAEIEAVKAQAVAARTYAIAHLGRREALGFDFHATVADQVYGGLGGENAVATRAVRETRGEIVTYDGLPILAYYHSTCGGRTAAIDQVWQSAPLPYLQSVSDAVEDGEGEYYCEISNRFRWDVHWAGDALRRILSESLADRRERGDNGSDVLGVEVIERIDEIEVIGYTPSARAEALRIVIDGETYVIPGDSIRWILQPESGRILNSTMFVLDPVYGDDGLVELHARGGGWGHGIGMCQMGAIGRARAGHDYRRILRTYYRDTEVVRLY